MYIDAGYAVILTFASEVKQICTARINQTGNWHTIRALWQRNGAAISRHFAGISQGIREHSTDWTKYTVRVDYHKIFPNRVKSVREILSCAPGLRDCTQIFGIAIKNTLHKHDVLDCTIIIVLYVFQQALDTFLGTFKIQCEAIRWEQYLRICR